MPTTTNDQVTMPTAPSTGPAELAPELDALRQRNERCIELAGHKLTEHTGRPATSARVGDVVVIYVAQAYRACLVRKITNTGRLVVAFTTPHSVHQARMLWNNHADPRNAWGSYANVLANADYRARLLYAKFLENQQLVRDGVATTAQLMCARSETLDAELAEMYAESEVRIATAWLERHDPAEIQAAFDKAYRADMLAYFTARKTPNQPWTGLVNVRERTVKPQHASLF